MVETPKDRYATMSRAGASRSSSIFVYGYSVSVYRDWHNPNRLGLPSRWRFKQQAYDHASLAQAVSHLRDLYHCIPMRVVSGRRSGAPADKAEPGPRH